MATQFAQTTTSPGPAPFMFGGAASGATRGGFAAALRRAVTAERAFAEGSKPSQRIARLLCELGENYGCRNRLPLSRNELATALGISLIRVKRTLALLSLSGVVDCDDGGLTVRDWRKLSGLARFDARALGLGSDQEDELEDCTDVELCFLTASGDPACFV